VDEGIELHDQGLYKDAVAKYEKALKIDPHSAAVLYELANTWYVLTDYEKSKEYSKQVVDMNEDYWIDAVILYGSSLENTGESKKAMKLYNTAVKKYPTNSLLRYSIGLNYFNAKQYDKAEENARLTIELNKGDAPAHLLMANTMLAKGLKLNCMLSLYYFLVIEQDTERSTKAFDLLNMLWDSMSSAKWPNDNKPRSKTVDPSLNIEFAMSTFKPQSGDELAIFNQRTTFLFNELSKTNWDETNFWYQNYISFFNEIIKLKHTDSYTYFISNCKYKTEVLKWISTHQSSFSAFINWMERQ
jgi:tetratricopeptide (TPR) repeat protein